MNPPNLLTHPLDARLARGENQSEFWSRFGLTQSAGSRFENRQCPIRGASRILIAAYQLRLVNDAQLEIIGKSLRSEGRSVPRFPMNVKAARLNHGETQTEFWSRFGVSQGSASRYERNARSIQRSLAILLALYFLKPLHEAELKAARQLASSSMRKTPARLVSMPKNMPA